MENVTKRAAFSPFQKSELGNEAGAIIEKHPQHYPIMMEKSTTEKGANLVSLTPYEVVGIDEINIEFGNEAKAVISMQIEKIKYVDPVTQEERFMKLPRIDSMKLDQFAEFSAGIAEIAEACRKMMNILAMTSEDITDLGIPNTGIVLADKLQGLPGSTNLQVENAIRKQAAGMTAEQISEMIKNHAAEKAVVLMKDTIASEVYKRFENACYTIAKKLKENNRVRIVSLEGTAIEPTKVTHQKSSVDEVAKLEVSKKNDGYADLL